MMYQPISCDYYDHLEALATIGKVVEVVYQSAEGKQSRKTDRIVTFFIQDKVEYLRLASNQEIRLDLLVSVDGEPLPASCGLPATDAK